ncbi:calcium-binding protein [Cribrihabitans sp. XS_ASV171]
MTFSDIADNSLLPFGETQMPIGDDNIAEYSIDAIFEDGFRFGTGTFDRLWVATNGGVSVNGSHWPMDDYATIFPWGADLDTRRSPLDTTGVYFDLDTDRDSVVVTWKDIGYYRQDYSDPITFQLELIDKGDGDSEIVFRYEDTGSSDIWSDSGIVQPDGQAIYFGGNALIDVPAKELDETPGNTGVVGVWQFHVADGSVVANPPIEGTDNADLLTGSVFADVIEGGAGDDTIRGNNGGDEINGGSGNDTIRGGNGNDVVTGGQGNDSIMGDAGRDIIHGGEGNDTITGGEGRDSVEAGDGDDLVEEAWNGEYWNNADTINGNDGNDTVFGGRGNDVLGGQSGDDMVRGGDGNDMIGGGSGNDVLSGGLGNDQFWGGAGDDFIYGDRGLNEATGGDGADTFLLTPEGTLTINDFNPDEGDRLIVNADYWDRGDFFLQTMRDGEGNLVGSNTMIMHRQEGDNAYRKVAEIRASEGLDSLQLNFPHDAGEAIAPIVWDLT